MKNQKRIRKALEKALRKRNVGKARDLITLLLARDKEEKEYKRSAYRAIVDTARKIGDINAMLEAAPFSGYDLCEGDFASCIARTIKCGTLETYVICKEGMNANICPKELAALLRKMKDKAQAHKLLPFLRFQTPELNLVIRMLRRIHPNDLTLEERVVIRLKH